MVNMKIFEYEKLNSFKGLTCAYYILENRRPNYFSKAKHILRDELTEDENGSDISSSFSLQECMKEFRARRIRRSYLNQQRQNMIRDTYGKNVKEANEIDFINQNLRNKEQERKCKPCRNGFCYCFTSDSGDSNHDGCKIFDRLQARRLYKNGRVARIQVLIYIHTCIHIIRIAKFS